LRIAVLLCLAGASAFAHAAPGASVPFTPDWATRHHIERLVDEAGLAVTTSQWPMPGAALEEALDALPDALGESLAASRDAVRRALAADRLASGGITLGRSVESLGGYADERAPGSSAALRTRVFGDSHGVVARLGVSLEQAAPALDGGRLGGRRAPRTVLSADQGAIVTSLFGLNVEAFAHRPWWGPGWQSSLILGQNAPPWAGLGIERGSVRPSASRWLSWLGPWTFNFFVAKARDPEVVDAQPTGYLFSGMRVTFRPTASVEVGLSRTIQTAGHGRPGGWHNFLRALLARGVNADTAQQRLVDPGNEMAGFDLRVRCPSGARCALYGQMIGEDEAGYLPSKYLALAGIEGWSGDGRRRWFAEWANSYCRGVPWATKVPGCAYLNTQYPQGYTNGARWIGASQGPDSLLLTLGVFDDDARQLVRLHWGHIGNEIGAYAPLLARPDRGTLAGASWQRSFDWREVTLTAGASWLYLRGAAGPRSAVQASLQWRWTFE
jgi:hypothetical protein